MNANTQLKLPPPWWKNPWTIGVVIFLAISLTLGVSMAVKGLFVGVIIATVTTVMFIKGLKTLAIDPMTFGLIEVWNRPVSSHNVISGVVPILPFFPFMIDLVEIDMTLRSEKIPVQDVLSKDDVSMKGEISVSYRPNKDDLIDFVGAGKMDGVIKNTSDLVIIETEKYCRQKGWREIQQRSPDFEQELKKMIETGSFGVIVERIQVRLNAPQMLLDDVIQAEREKGQRQGELAEYDTTTIAAERRIEAIKKASKPGDKIPSLAEVIEIIKHERLIRNDKVLRIEGNAKTIAIAEANFNTGGGKK